MNSDDIQNIFFIECEESLEAAEAGLDACKAGTQDGETINAIFRAVHSIKGGAGAFGYAALQAFTHTFETLLSEVREGSVALDAELVNMMLLALDCLRDHVDAARSGTDAPDDAAIMARLEQAVETSQANGDAGAAAKPASGKTQAEDLDALLDDLLAAEPQDEDAPVEEAPAGEAAATWQVHLRPHAGAMANGSEPMLWLRELRGLGGECIACDTDSVPPLGEFDVAEGYLGWTFAMPGEVTHEHVAEIFDFVGEDCSIAWGSEETIPPLRPRPAEPAAAEPQVTEAAVEPAKPGDSKEVAKPAPAPAPAAQAAPTQSIRVDLSKLDTLIDGVGELVIAQAMLAQRLANENLAHIEELAMLEGLVRDIQEHAMAFRAQPIGSVFSRVPRLLRELSSSTGKHVKLQVTGETTELDKTVIERLSEPLTHLIRNAVDHGIEDAEERQAAGKDPEGTLSLSAEQKAGRIVIRIADDGRGIAADKVLAKAVANGLVEEGAQLSQDEINNLIFAPGFSTAAQVSSISGRGVGMDVVRQNVKDLGGRITIESTPGAGTAFVLALPLTLAISDGMIVQLGDQSLVIPLTHVVESLRPQPGDLKGMGTDRQMLNVRGRFLPVVPLAAIAGRDMATTDPCEGVLVIVETESYGQAALLVDAITDQRQFVIKTLDTHYRAVDSVAGATILGNGRVALIVDVDQLVKTASAMDQGGPANLLAAA
ncbi:chemotaxis protein CheA [Alteraurantiacibacter aquimixticola]|uniref:Chemotaxis protein CheA n=1 Tax=Alteraurantiacibacter aquimixticola TaxID=2489173 RepID=A0A4T3EX80_9SPHN|nr:chemotaxis protein CheA [Alteraurantiacibacter aquimixticola]TIX49068.1 chemotaxis protein CheA [Alteraurantiacibacter aquimixticola]